MANKITVNTFDTEYNNNPSLPQNIIPTFILHFVNNNLNPYKNSPKHNTDIISSIKI